MDSIQLGLNQVAAVAREVPGAAAQAALPAAYSQAVDAQDAIHFARALESQPSRQGTTEIHGLPEGQGSLERHGVPESHAAGRIIRTAESAEPSLAEGVLDKMQALSSTAEHKGEQLERQILRAMDTLNPLDMIAANRMMSEYYLENLMTAKLIGKATQAIERLTSLQ